MRLLFRQRFFSWFDSYDIYDERENPVYTVKGQLSWGHCLKIFNRDDREVGTVKEKIFTFLPKFELYENEQYLGCKELFHMTDTYVLDIEREEDALHVLMFVLAMDAEKCSRN